jgi:hypothetical protein
MPCPFVWLYPDHRLRHRFLVRYFPSNFSIDSFEVFFLGPDRFVARKGGALYSSEKGSDTC